MDEDICKKCTAKSGLKRDDCPAKDEDQCHYNPAKAESFRERVVEEGKELQKKIDKLAVFVEGEKYEFLPESEKGRQATQLAIMRAYRAILVARIAAAFK